MHLPSASPISAAFFVSASLIFGGSFWFFDCSWLHFVILSETSWAHLASLHLHIWSLNSVIFAIAAPELLPAPFFLQPNERTTIAETRTNVSFFIACLLGGVTIAEKCDGLHSEPVSLTKSEKEKTYFFSSFFMSPAGAAAEPAAGAAEPAAAAAEPSAGAAEPAAGSAGAAEPAAGSTAVPAPIAACMHLPISSPIAAAFFVSSSLI